MLTAISYKIYELRRYLVLSLVISIIAIPIGDMLVIQRDRNRNEMYGEAFWIYGFEVYNMTDAELLRIIPPEWGFNDTEHNLPDYLGNITYEYPVFCMLFFAIAVWLFPGVNELQSLWINFLLVLVFNLNLVLIAILFGDKIYNVRWVRLFIGGYIIYGLIMSAGGGKPEPLADCLMLMAMVLRREQKMGKAMFTLGLAVQTKIYPGVLFPVLFLEAPTATLWFVVSMMLTAVPFFFMGFSIDSLVNHILNTSTYSSYIVNPMYPGLGLATPDLETGLTYFWPPGFIPVVIYLAFVLYTIESFLPPKASLLRMASDDSAHRSTLRRLLHVLRHNLLLLVPLYIFFLPGILFLYRWVMPWYLFWFGLLTLLIDNEEQAVGFLKALTVVGLVYTLGLACNWPYFITGPVIDFARHFILGWFTLVGIGILCITAFVFYWFWKWEIERRVRKELYLREAEARGELVI